MLVAENRRTDLRKTELVRGHRSQILDIVRASSDLLKVNTSGMDSPTLTISFEVAQKSQQAIRKLPNPE